MEIFPSFLLPRVPVTMVSCADFCDHYERALNAFKPIFNVIGVR